MEYLLINGSPRRGNTWKIVEEVKRCITNEDSDGHFSEIHLFEEEIPFCTGCSNCFRIGGQQCPHKDKIEKIAALMEKADGIIINSTAFTNRETSILRNFFNHLEYLIHRPFFFGKKAIVVTSTSGIGARPAAKSISSFLYLIGFSKCYNIAVKTYSWNAYQLTDQVRSKCRNAAKKLYNSISQNISFAPSFQTIMWYNLFRGTATTLGPNSMFPTEDGAHWLSAEWKDRSYSNVVKVALPKRIFGQVVYFMFTIIGKTITVTYGR